MDVKKSVSATLIHPFLIALYFDQPTNRMTTSSTVQISTEADGYTDVREIFVCIKSCRFIIETFTGLYIKRYESGLTLPCRLNQGLKLVSSFQWFPINIIYKLCFYEGVTWLLL